MKNMKPFILAVLTTFSSAFAANDPVVEQINITKDAVNVALEEISRGGIQTTTSSDAEVKMRQFSTDASKALVKFEEAVRVRVLQSFSVLVNQYNSAYQNQALGTARADILASLKKQMSVVAQDKSQIYKQAYLELYSVMPNLPIQFDFAGASNNEWNGSRYVPTITRIYKNYESKKKNGACIYISGINDCDYNYFYNYVGDVYLAKTQTKKIDVSLKQGYNGNFSPDQKGVYELLVSQGFPTKDDARRMLLDGCYTSTCYFLMQSQYTIWKSMIEATLARDIKIELADGSEIVITKDVNRNGLVIRTLDSYLTNIETEGLINNLPYEISAKRMDTLTLMNNFLASNKCSKAKNLKDDLCHATEEGCLKPSESALLKDRHGKNANCL